MKLTNPIIVFTDGSANWVNKLGGSGVYLIIDGSEYFLQKGFTNTKVGRTEIHAVLMALESISDKSRDVQIFSDSQYVVSAISRGWVKGWERIGFRGKKNGDLWKRILIELGKFKGNVNISHVKGHSGVEGNEIADMLAAYKQFNSEQRIEDENH